MTTNCGFWRLRGAARAAGTALSLMLAVTVLTGLLQAGKRYVDCRAMRQVMSHACCSGHASTERTNAAALSEIAADCCQARSVRALGAWTQAARAAEFSAPVVAVALPSPFGLAAVTSVADFSERDRIMRTGPPRSRVLARLMVFRI
jgi:hypothetical protein